ncbi:hypothetical protein VIOR3934_16106 [Vibrio orientalis CIP 102891 = ATCC 33934]|uniref:Uncharacterized protein n=1 Tax=Vibrio orientalis CIP 102891 = ATCC 33934 TaxID=675816 RepID=C9QIM9_VIBOR|nr:hypothetical protein [Vibrio orientalis]EEX92756.1 hypothetical protein VIA_003401 [Vibrio orientalis CIP 102891 = ATCC 33934]EGU52542.1 hypothetical protein VIOR3934_16106 [Vibrio orientalis CIP 102891 = ATCC 33934]
MLIKKLEAPHDMQIGARFETKKHGYVTVIEYYNTHTVIVAFENTGNIRAITAAKLRSGQVSDRSVPPQSSMVGEKVESIKHGILTIIQVESENIVVLENEEGEEIRMLLPAVQKLKDKVDELDGEKEAPELPTSLSALTKRNKKTKDVNSLLKKMLTDYGK